MTRADVDDMVESLRKARDGVFECHLEELQNAIVDWMDEVIEVVRDLGEAVVRRDE